MREKEGGLGDRSFPGSPSPLAAPGTHSLLGTLCRFTGLGWVWLHGLCWRQSGAEAPCVVSEQTCHWRAKSDFFAHQMTTLGHIFTLINHHFFVILKLCEDEGVG